MIVSKFIKSILISLAIAVNLFGFGLESSNAYPVFAQQNYSNPRAANGKLACANCHLNQKAIEVESPQAVLPNSVFEVTIKVPYDTTKKQVDATGKKADLNVGGILILPKGFKAASKNQISKEIKAKNKGVFTMKFWFKNICKILACITKPYISGVLLPVNSLFNGVKCLSSISYLLFIGEPKYPTKTILFFSSSKLSWFI